MFVRCLWDVCKVFSGICEVFVRYRVVQKVRYLLLKIPITIARSKLRVNN